jgi:hypothetical protein
MLGDLEGFIVFIPFIYLAMAGAAYLVMRRKIP